MIIIPIFKLRKWVFCTLGENRPKELLKYHENKFWKNKTELLKYHETLPISVFERTLSTKIVS